ncbi:MAG: GrpB family protein [Anaerolineae bacterium]|nr:GrpB family protein [Anaerolineae bacterium]
MRRVEVVDYDPEWKHEFERLRSVYLHHMGHLNVDVQHVGSTSVPGLAAKPIIDIDIIVDSAEAVTRVIGALRELGYIHLGDGGIAGREVFERASTEVPYCDSRCAWPGHHLYVCIDGCTSLKNHLLFRDCLRSRPDVARAYGRLKKELALRYEYSIDTYVEKKTPFIARILTMAGLAQEDVYGIVLQNTKPADR